MGNMGEKLEKELLIYVNLSILVFVTYLSSLRRISRIELTVIEKNTTPQIINTMAKVYSTVFLSFKSP